MRKTSLENVFSQLSNVNNIDDMLRDEGLNPEQIVNEGIQRIKEFQSSHVSKKRVIDLLEIKMKESITNETKKAFEALKNLIPSMNGQQVSMVFRGLNNPAENDININKLVRQLKSDAELLKIMKKYNSGEGK